MEEDSCLDPAWHGHDVGSAPAQALQLLMGETVLGAVRTYTVGFSVSFSVSFSFSVRISFSFSVSVRNS